MAFSIYSINYYELKKIDSLFYEKTYELSNRYPFKWYTFINKIIANKKITYFNDTTMIVNLIDLDIHNVKILFEVIKEYFKEDLFKKVIYKKEFIIVHFHTNLTKDVFERKNLWQVIYLYSVLKKEYKNLNLYLRGNIRYNNEIEEVDLIINDKDNYYLVNSNNQIKRKYYKSTNLFLYNELYRNQNILEDNNLFRFSFNENQLLSNFETIKCC